MKTFKPLMFALLAGLPLAAMPAMAASDSAGTNSATSATKSPELMNQTDSDKASPTVTYSQSGTAVPGTPSQATPPSAPSKASATSGEGNGGGK